MSENRTPFEPNRFCWNELVAGDPAVARAFYEGVFGWKAEAFGGASHDYTLFKQGDATIGGMMQCPQPGLPSHWLPYVVVEDLNQTVARAEQLGAKTVLPPREVPTVGRIAVLVDPQGAAFALLQPAAPAEG